MDANLGDVGMTVLISAATGILASWITWQQTQRSWRHRERYEAAVGVLAEARRHEVLTSEWRRLRERKDAFYHRVQELSSRPENDFQLSEARRRLAVAEDKLAKVNDLMLDSVTGVDGAVVKLDLLARGELAVLGAAIADAQAQVDRDRDDGIPLDAARAVEKQAKRAFIEAARDELGSGRSAK